MSNSRESFFKFSSSIGLGDVVALIPVAILGAIFKALGFTTLFKIVSFSVTMLPAAMGIAIAISFGLTSVEAISLAIASMVGSGVVHFVDKGFLLAGTGDVINAGITCFIGLAVIKLLKGKAKSFALIYIPIILIAFVGQIGLWTLPYVSFITGELGHIINTFTTLQPVLMCILIAMSYSIIIVTPISTVAIAMAISLTGLASGAANLGIVACAFGLGITGYTSNKLGGSLAPIIGSPKIHMGNFIKKPIILLPILANAIVLGILGALFNIGGTPFSAGFGISGGVGPINAIDRLGWDAFHIALVLIIFIAVPVALGFLFKYIFLDKLKLVSHEDYKLDL